MEDIMRAAMAIGLTDDEQEKLKAQLLADQERHFAAQIAALEAEREPDDVAPGGAS